MYKNATKLKLRFPHANGLLSIEQLWTLPLTDLDNMAVSLEASYKNSKGKSFLDVKTTKDKNIKLQFDIVLDVLQTKIDENAILRDAKGDKEYNQKIMEMIAVKQDSDLQELSISELKKKLRK